MLETVECVIYSCRNTTTYTQTVEAVIDGVTAVMEVCDEHKAFFEATPAEQYAIGFVFTGEVEVRPIPKQPHEPRPAPTE